MSNACKKIIEGLKGATQRQERTLKVFSEGIMEIHIVLIENYLQYVSKVKGNYKIICKREKKTIFEKICFQNTRLLWWALLIVYLSRNRILALHSAGQGRQYVIHDSFTGFLPLEQCVM